MVISDVVYDILWGKSTCGELAFVDMQRRFAYNQPAPEWVWRIDQLD
jgi:hypothetical protein